VPVVRASARGWRPTVLRVPGARAGPPNLIPLYGNEARVDGSDTAAFRWLRRNTAPTDTVVNEPTTDASLWMYADENVRPLLAMQPFRVSAPREYQERQLTRHLIKRDALRANPQFSLVFHEDNVFVFPYNRR
jgi:hypothetical protein